MKLTQETLKKMIAEAYEKYEPSQTSAADATAVTT